MYSVNRAQIIGILTEDPVIRQTTTGQSVGTLNIATKYSFKDKEGSFQEGTNYHSVEVWRGLADICGQYLRKDRTVYISGRLSTDTWEDETGKTRSKTRIVADEMIMLDSLNQTFKTIPGDSQVKGHLNQGEVIGNVTKDPEARQTPTGVAVANFGVATNYSWKDKEGQVQEKTTFHNIVAWGNLASEASKYLEKGRKVYITGRIQTRSWETNEGDKRYTTEIIAEKMLALGQPVSSDATQPAASDTKSAQPVAAAAPASGKITEDMVPEINYEKNIKPEDLPF